MELSSHVTGVVQLHIIYVEKISQVIVKTTYFLEELLVRVRVHWLVIYNCITNLPKKMCPNLGATGWKVEQVYKEIGHLNTCSGSTNVNYYVISPRGEM